MSEQILAALDSLDVKNDNHWTPEGLPALAAVRMLASNAAITPEEIAAVRPGFTRASLADPNAAAESQEAAPFPGAAEKPAAQLSNPNNEGEQAEVVLSDVPGEAEKQALAEEASQLVGELSSMDEYVQTKFKKERDLRQARLDEIRKRQAVLDPPMTEAEANLRYRQNSHAAMKARGAVRKTIIDSGVDLGAVLKTIAPAPLDLALKNRPRQ